MTNCISLPDDNLGLIHRMISYCYLMDYPDQKCERLYGPAADESYVSKTHLNAQMYALADKYEIAGLKELAAEKFESTLFMDFGDWTVDSFSVKRFLMVAYVVYRGTPDGDFRLRKSVVGFIQWHWPHFRAEPEFETFISENPKFVLDLVDRERDNCHSVVEGPG